MWKIGIIRISLLSALSIPLLMQENKYFFTCNFDFLKVPSCLLMLSSVYWKLKWIREISKLRSKTWNWWNGMPAILGVCINIRTGCRWVVCWGVSQYFNGTNNVDQRSQTLDPIFEWDYDDSLKVTLSVSWFLRCGIYKDFEDEIHWYGNTGINQLKSGWEM